MTAHPQSPPESSDRAPTVVHITPPSGLFHTSLRELWSYRELIFFLAWRDIKVRYKQTFLGAAWALLQPISTMLIFTIVFGKLAKVDSDGLPYPVFSYAALIPWTFFATGLDKASNSLVGNANMVQKVYFPRLASPLSAISSGLLDFVITFSVLLVLMVYYGIAPRWQMVTLPILLLLAFSTAAAVGFWFAAVNVRYRDVRYTIPFVVQLWLLATPVGYSSSMIEEKYRLLYALNPMVGVVEGFRWALLGTGRAPGPELLVSVAVVSVLLFGGVLYFSRLEKSFADMI